MSGVDFRGRTARVSSVACTVIWLMAGPGQAQSSFGGSFDSAPVNTAPTGTPAPQSLGGFGGSFDDGGATQPQPSNPVPETGDGFDSGSFDTDIVPVPPQPAPQPQPTLPPNVDPQILAFESRDFGVPATHRLKSGQLHGPTPANVPGASLVATQALASALASGQKLLLIDVLGGTYSLPRAMMAPALASPGHFGDRVQQQAIQWLTQITGGQRDIPIVIYCSDPQCWLSYNATLRTVAAGFTNVYWYRGGLQAWQMAGLQLAPAGF